MQNVFAKIFASLWSGSLRKKAFSQLVFIYLLCHSDSEGMVDRDISTIVDDTGLPESDVRSAIEMLMAPDPRSRSKKEGGRRLLPLDPDRDWGWQIVNYDEYRRIRNSEDRKQQVREAVQRHRRAKRLELEESSDREANSPPPTSAPTELPFGFPRTEDEAVDVGQFIGVPKSHAVIKWNEWVGYGGKTERGAVIQDFRRVLKADWEKEVGRKAEYAKRDRNGGSHRKGPDRNANWTANPKPGTPQPKRWTPEEFSAMQEEARAKRAALAASKGPGVAGQEHPVGRAHGEV